MNEEFNSGHKKYRGAVGLTLSLVAILFFMTTLFIIADFNLVYTSHTDDFMNFANEFVAFVTGLTLIVILIGLIFFISGFKYSSRWVKIIGIILYFLDISFLILPVISEAIYFKFIFWVFSLGS